MVAILNIQTRNVLLYYMRYGCKIYLYANTKRDMIAILY